MPVELGSFNVIIVATGGDIPVAVIHIQKLKSIGQGMPGLVSQISAKKEEDKSERKQIEDVPIVRDFLEVFPEDLSGLPPA
ncbi:hypothetical protein Tco_0105459 [Tanacetum coccineum]